MSEGQNIEWKKSWHDDYLKWVCGFANAIGAAQDQSLPCGQIKADIVQDRRTAARAAQTHDMQHSDRDQGNRDAAPFG